MYKPATWREDADASEQRDVRASGRTPEVQLWSMSQAIFMLESLFGRSKYECPNIRSLARAHPRQGASLAISRKAVLVFAHLGGVFPPALSDFNDVRLAQAAAIARSFWPKVF